MFMTFINALASAQASVANNTSDKFPCQPWQVTNIRGVDLAVSSGKLWKINMEPKNHPFNLQWCSTAGEKTIHANHLGCQKTLRK